MQLSIKSLTSLTSLLILFATLTARAAEPKLIDLRSDGHLVARYVAEPNPMKPYVKELFTPSGVQVMLDSPPDHVHHHGLMFAIGAGATDFWAEKPPEKFGKQVPQEGHTKNNSSWLTQALDWIAPGGQPQLVERRAIRIHGSANGGPNFLTWETGLRPAEGVAPIKLYGSHYFGLGLRLIPDLNGKVTFLHPPKTPEGRNVRGNEFLTSGTWCAATGEVGGKPVTVAMWDDPRNKRPAEWFTMGVPFAYLAGTFDLEKNPMMLNQDETLRMRYGVAIFDGIADAATIEKAHQDWLDTKEPFFDDAISAKPAPKINVQQIKSNKKIKKEN